MSIITSSVSGGTRKGPGGRREVYVSGTGWVPAAAAPPDALKPKASPASGDPVRHTATTKQHQAWTAVAEHGTQQAACKALGISQGTLQARLKGYMQAMGLEGKLPGYLPKGGSDQQVTHEPAREIIPETDPAPVPAPAVSPVETVRPPVETRPAAPPSRVETVVAAAYAIGRASALLRLLAATEGPLNDAQRQLATACAHGLEETL